jgi:hypothetical protein
VMYCVKNHCNRNASWQCVSICMMEYQVKCVDFQIEMKCYLFPHLPSDSA